MTREEANKRLEKISPTWKAEIDRDGDLDINGYFSASDLRAIADILDQVGKEDGKAGGDFQNGNNQIERGGA